MQSNVRRMMQIAATLFLVLGLASTAWAGGRWKVGDVVVCFGSGTCKVVRPGPAAIPAVAPPATVPLDTIGDGTTFSPPGPILNPGDNRGVAINNTLHLLVTDAGASGTKANVVEYQIAGSDPTSGNPVAHGVATVFNSSGVGGIQTVALDKTGNMFILNANGTDPLIAELNQAGAPVGTPIHLATQCTPTVTQVASMDLSADGSSAYVTEGGTIRGTIQKVNLSTGGCTTFADFGSGVTLYGIKDIPPNALPTSPTSCGNPNGCPTSETILVVAKGFVDIDTGETEPANNTDAVNVCTNATGGTAESCALLLNTQPSNPSLTGPVWAADHLYGAATVGTTTILDAFLHVQKVFSAGKSGADEPLWGQHGETVRDNAVIWTDQGQKQWTLTTNYALTNIVVDPAGHVQIVTTAGKSASTEPSPWNDAGGTTTDGLIWTDQGQKVWTSNFAYSASAVVVDPAGHVQQVTTPGTSGPGPAPTFNDFGSTTTDGLTWINQGPGAADAWMPNTSYPVDATVLDTNGKVEKAATAGTSGAGAGPTWNITVGGTTVDNAVIWTDQGGWVANHTYALGNTVGDAGQHLQKVTTAGISGPSTAPAFDDNGGTTPDNAVVWTDNGTWAPTHAYLVGDLVGDTGQHLQKVTTKGTSGPGPSPPTFDHSGSTTTDGLQWTDQGSSPSVVARYRVTQPSVQTSLQALALNPLIRDCTTLGSCSPTLPSPKVSNFWLADSVSGTFFKLDFASGTSTMFNTAAPSCTGCSGIQSIGIYGAEDAAQFADDATTQPGLTQLPSVSLSPGLVVGTTTTAQFDFNPNPGLFPGTNDDNQLKVTGYNFPSSFTPLALTVYASAIDFDSGFSDKLSTPTPPPNAPIFTDPVKCTVATSQGQCVVWQLDNNDLPTNSSCATKPSTCPFLWVKLDFLNATVRAATNFNNVIGVLDEQYDATASPDTGFPKVKCQLSQHTISPTVPGATNCTYLSPLPASSSSSSSPACFTTSRTNIPVKFTCASLPTGKTLADLLPFLHAVQLFPPIPGGNEASLQPLQGTGGTVNYRLTSGQWNFNFNNPGFGYGPSPSPSGPRTDYLVWTGDATHVVEDFYTRFYVKKSCP